MRGLLSAAFFCSFNRGQFVVRVTTDLIDEITPDSASTPYIFLLSPHLIMMAEMHGFEVGGMKQVMREITSHLRWCIDVCLLHHFEYSP